MSRNEPIQVGFQAFLSDREEEFGAVQDVSPQGITIYVENAGDFTVSYDAVQAVHSEKVILDRSKLDPRLLLAIEHSHDAEE
jgi:hypothetical protein